MKKNSLLHNQFPVVKGKPEGANAPSETIIPPLLLKERGIKGVRLINNLNYRFDKALAILATLSYNKHNIRAARKLFQNGAELGFGKIKNPGKG